MQPNVLFSDYDEKRPGNPAVYVSVEVLYMSAFKISFNSKSDCEPGSSTAIGTRQRKSPGSRNLIHPIANYNALNRTAAPPAADKNNLRLSALVTFCFTISISYGLVFQSVLFASL